jgi:putative transposase
MARLARVVACGYPHHVTQRGNRPPQTFFCESDYAEYVLMAQSCARCGTAVWAYCLMPKHVHLVMVPQDPDGLRCAIAEAHRRYTRSRSICGRTGGATSGRSASTRLSWTKVI